MDISPMGREAFLDTMSMVGQAQDGINVRLRTLGILVTNINPRTVFEREVEEPLRQEYEDVVFKTAIPHSIKAKREEFKSMRCVVEKGLPDDLEARIRQLAENASRQDLPAMARARSMLGVKACLARSVGIEVSPKTTLHELEEAITGARYRGSGTRVPRPGDRTADTQGSAAAVPDSNELDEMVGRTLRQYAGRAVSGRMVRNYLALLRLPTDVQELADAANLTEFCLRPVVDLDEPDHQLAVVKRIVEEDLSGRQVDALAKQAQSAAEGEKRTLAERMAKGRSARGL